MLGIVIANWNGEKILQSCLESLKNQSFKDFKVYIIDNGSKDKSIDIIENYKANLAIELEMLSYNSGFAKANNIGISKAFKDGCDYILTLNNDIEMKSDCLEIAMRDIANEKNEYDIFQLFMINYYNRNQCDAAGLSFDEKLYVTQLGYKEDIEDVINNVNYIDGVCAGAAIYSRECLEKVVLKDENYFDSNFFAYYEDVDLALRLKINGFKSKLLKDSVVYHMHSVTGNINSGFKDYYLTRNFLIYTKRNQSKDKYRINKYYYSRPIIKSVLKNIFNTANRKPILKGIKDGIIEAKNTKSIVSNN
ncbi:MAG: glycosyltransferase family 2 protein [Clostridium sp.]